MYLGFAEAWVRKGQPQQAIFYLEKTIQAFPGSKQAEMAQILLARLTGPMVRSTDSKK
jgi:outer membrane protein assembly factor BamD (BamD/ComL family)